MSEQLLKKPKQAPSNSTVIKFMIILSLICAVVLSALASALKDPQEIAKELDRSKQMMIAAKIFTHAGYFLIENGKGEYVPAKNVGNGTLALGTVSNRASNNDILEVYKRRFAPFLVDSKGEKTTFEKAGIDINYYIAEYRKSGYYKQPLKLIYEILPNSTKDSNETQPIGYVIPVNGFGLWDAIYGYLAIEPDGETVIGISWYDQKETPGLGANIAEEPWQNLFPGKKIFQPSAVGEIYPASAPIGITVVKGRVSEVLGDIPKAKSAVDGMPGATLTGNGVTDAYRNVLEGYRPFFIKIHQKTEN
ncbi:MAG TPA: NADH:ubiquinone reductase (Na(+)-transporting) subunit C [Waddliaceae bacterium]